MLDLAIVADLGKRYRDIGLVDRKAGFREFLVEAAIQIPEFINQKDTWGHASNWTPIIISISMITAILLIMPFWWRRRR